MPHLYIVGRGAMGRATAAFCEAHNVPHSVWKEPPAIVEPDAVAIHVGGRVSLIAVLAWCKATGTPLIFAASGLNESQPKHVSDFVLVLAPSLSLRVISCMERIGQHKTQAHMSGVRTKITVSHQLTKDTPPGLAHAIAEMLGVPTSVIEEIRSVDQQVDFGVPLEHIERHSHHVVEMHDGHRCIFQLELRVNGLGEYAEGAVAIAESIIALRTISPGIYSASWILQRAGKLSRTPETVPG